MKLDSGVPWGRLSEEYRSMLPSTGKDRKNDIPGCEDGVARCDADLSCRGGSVVSADSRMPIAWQREVWPAGSARERSATKVKWSIRRNEISP